MRCVSSLPLSLPLPLSLSLSGGKLTKKGTKSKSVSTLFLFVDVVLFVCMCITASAPEEEGERGAAGGRHPGLREDPHGEEQPPEGPGQDGENITWESHHMRSIERRAFIWNAAETQRPIYQNILTASHSAGYEMQTLAWMTSHIGHEHGRYYILHSDSTIKKKIVTLSGLVALL